MSASELQRLCPQAPDALYSMLDGDQGHLDPPIRSELFGGLRFSEHGASLGITHQETSCKARETFFPRLNDNIVRLRSAYEYIGVQADAGYDISPAAEWLIENFHLLEAQFKEISEGLPVSYFRTLPVLVNAPMTGLPRVYGIAWAYVAHTDGAFDENLLVQFLEGYQAKCELKLSELWALPTTLRVVLMENLRRLAERVAANKGARALANLCCDQLGDYDLNALDALHHILMNRGVGRTFLVQMALRLHDSHPESRATYLDWLKLVLPDYPTARAQQGADQAADNLSVSNAVTALRAIGDADWCDIVARLSRLMQLMLTSEVFASEHTLTRDRTLHAIEQLALQSDRSETMVAQTLLTLILENPSGTEEKTVPSFWLLGAGRIALESALGCPSSKQGAIRNWTARNNLAIYASTVMMLTLALTLYWVLKSTMPNLWQLAALSGLLFFPMSEAVVALINRLVSESKRPVPMHRLAFALGIPAEHKVLVVVPCMLGNEASIACLAQRLLMHYLANKETNAQFALLSDWLDAPEPCAENDEALLNCARTHIVALNKKYPRPADEVVEAPRFVLLHRSRTFSVSEQAWIGWERKRGKIEQLVQALATHGQGSFLDLGIDSKLEPNSRYVVTLDSDTQMPPGQLRDLVGIAAHPFNAPRFDARKKRVVSGYGILQPRVATPLPLAGRLTHYHWLFAGQFGLDPYGAAGSDIYQDLFGEGSFMGKGLLNVAAMHATLSERFPSDQILSHDLIEGALARCGSVTDINLMEDAPFHADVAAARLHRWTRGDWQLIPVLMHARRLGISALNVWKILDNLRRSLVAPASLGLIVLSLWGQTLSLWFALLLVLGAYTSGPLMGAFAGFVPSRADSEPGYFLEGAFADLARALAGGLWHLALLLQGTLQALDAITQALYRMAISHRHLLKWTTAEASQARAHSNLKALMLQHWGAPIAAAVLISSLAFANVMSLPVMLLVMVWGAAPVWIWFVSRMLPPAQEAQLTPAMEQDLYQLARDTWRYFERTVTAADHHLPPDNLQVIPQDMLAQRTSPTNIGLYMLSVACARSFGWIATVELIDRLEATYTTLKTLRRERGHFLNWYDTQTCAALLPAYVSTVDSGNLSAHLLCVAQACYALARDPKDASVLTQALALSKKRIAELLPARIRRNSGLRLILKSLLQEHRALLSSCEHGLVTLSVQAADDCVHRLQTLALQLETLAWEPDFAFLYHRKRRLLHIGYRPLEQQLDPGFYDLLASEARLASLVAIAKADVPVAHWAALGRTYCVMQGVAGLRSWSGSMFEYLMPGLVIAEPLGSVLSNACSLALREQIAVASTLKVPWGISESAYAARDHTLAYQYAPQGVPRLALRRTPHDELVIAPYASVMAVQRAPVQVWRNLQTFDRLGVRGRYGLLEAMDYSPARQTGQGSFVLVGCYMAHHQGMSLVALTNALQHGLAQKWCMANPQLQAITSLLHERTPREISRLYTLPVDLPPQMLRKRQPGLLRDVTPGNAAIEPTHILSNGRYSVALQANGAGWSRWGPVGISRWRDDLLRNAFGHFIYLDRSMETGQSRTVPLISITQHPAADRLATYESTFHADRVCFKTEWNQISTHMTVWISPEDDIEFRQVILNNLSDEVIEVELISAFDVTLTTHAADESHPAFSGMFIRAEWNAEQKALLFERRPRLQTDAPVHAAHFFICNDATATETRICTSRADWLGRGRDNRNPLGQRTLANACVEADALTTGLDPVCALGARFRLAPFGKSTVTFCTAIAANKETLYAVIDKYQQATHVQRASLMSATLAGIRLRALKINSEQFAALQSVCTALLWSVSRQQGQDPESDPSPCPLFDRRLLWRFGISADHPILLVSAGLVQSTGMLRSLTQALRMWSWSGVACDLVVLNFEPPSYTMPLQREIALIGERLSADLSSSSTPGTLHLLHAYDLSAGELAVLKGMARVHWRADGRPLIHHLNDWIASHQNSFDARNLYPSLRPPGLSSQNRQPIAAGEFDSLSGAYTFTVKGGAALPRPWSNVLANPGFGALITETGGGFTWGGNSRLHQMTAWSNDPVSDPTGEWWLLQDHRNDQVWSLTPNQFAAPETSYRITHGQGITTMAHSFDDMNVELTWCVDHTEAIKTIRIGLHHTGIRPRSLRLLGFVEWILGSKRQDRTSCMTRLLKVDQDPPVDMTVMCTQALSDEGFGEATGFLSLSCPQNALSTSIQWTCDRQEFFDPFGHLRVPQQLGSQGGQRLDPCGALATTFTMQPASRTEFVFRIGHAPNLKAATELAVRASDSSALQGERTVAAWWDGLLGRVQVRTPDPLLDALVNRWFLYQTISCRLWAKAAFYQAGGATGFRDQLQDAMALAWSAPTMLRQQIVLCASRQFPQGDVQHWWHTPSGAGVRTHFKDDLLWLAFALSHYLRATHDMTLLEVEVPFLEGPLIAPDAEDAYFTPTRSSQNASVWEHAARSIDASLLAGTHGLPLMGSGDWNDGMNAVGQGGRGESVWLGWFLCCTIAHMVPWARQRNEMDRANRWETAASHCQAALISAGWDGAWFRRAYFDNGDALGASVNAECRIDLIAQAWSVLSGASPLEMQITAMDSAHAGLVDENYGLVKLLAPPLQRSQPSAGYIQAYPPGVRENGGQYAHGALWAMMAQARLHTQGALVATHGALRCDLVYQYFQYMSPAHRSVHPVRGVNYGLEPYAMAGDVYGSAPYAGQGGWSWYTGAAGLMHRAVIESMFGLQQEADSIRLTPCLPSHWNEASLSLSREDQTLHFTLVRATIAQANQSAIDNNGILLQAGESLNWRDLSRISRIIIRLEPT